MSGAGQAVVETMAPAWWNLPAETREAIAAHLAQPPTRLGAIADAIGVTVLVSPLARGTSAKIRQEHESLVVRLNRRESRARQRFVLGHQLAHAILHREAIVADGGWSENALLKSGQPQAIEDAATGLGLDLVVPLDRLRETVRLPAATTPEGGADIEMLATMFRVPRTILEARLCRLAVVDGMQLA